MKTQTINVHNTIQRLLESKDYDTVTYLVDLYSNSGQMDELISIFEAMNVTVKEMQYKSEAKALYPVMIDSINILKDRKMTDLAVHFFSPGNGVIAREIEMKAVC